MKKLSAMVMAGVMALGMVGCGSTAAEAPAESTAPAAESTAEMCIRDSSYCSYRTNHDCISIFPEIFDFHIFIFHISRDMCAVRDRSAANNAYCYFFHIHFPFF